MAISDTELNEHPVVRQATALAKGIVLSGDPGLERLFLDICSALAKYDADKLKGMLSLN